MNELQPLPSTWLVRAWSTRCMLGRIALGPRVRERSTDDLALVRPEQIDAAVAVGVRQDRRPDVAQPGGRDIDAAVDDRQAGRAADAGSRAVAVLAGGCGITKVHVRLTAVVGEHHRLAGEQPSRRNRLGQIEPRAERLLLVLTRTGGRLVARPNHGTRVELPRHDRVDHEVIRRVDRLDLGGQAAEIHRQAVGHLERVTVVDARRCTLTLAERAGAAAHRVRRLDALREEDQLVGAKVRARRQSRVQQRLAGSQVHVVAHRHRADHEEPFSRQALEVAADLPLDRRGLLDDDSAGLADTRHLARRAEDA